MSATTEDAILGGRVRILQPEQGYRVAIDPVLLAAAIPARADETVLDLGCGTGAVGLCLLARVPARVIGIEAEPAIADLARNNAALNGVADRFDVIDAVLSMDVALPSARHAAINPPYHDAATHRAPREAHRARAHMASEGLTETFVARAIRAIETGGTVTVIHRADALGPLLAAMAKGLGAIRVLPVAPFAEKPATRVIVQGVKGRRTPLTLLPPFVLHEADGAFTEAAEAVLRDAAPLSTLV